MKKNGFTLIELMVVITTIVLIFGGLIFGVMNATKSGDTPTRDLPVFFSPEFENAKSQRMMVEELRRQNDLLERQLNREVTPERR